MKVIIREAAEDDLDRVFAWIAKDNPRAAADMVSRIRNRINRLELNSITSSAIASKQRDELASPHGHSLGARITPYHIVEKP